jgi:hypothetical protein
MDINSIIDSMNKLSQLGVTTILLVIVGGLAWYVWRENEERKKNDDILDRLEDSFDRIATAVEHQNKIYEWMKGEVEHYRNNNARLKDNIEFEILNIGRDVHDIKSAVLHGRVTAAT